MPPLRWELVSGRSAVWQWSVLVGLSVTLVVIAEILRVPAALLIGPMIAAIAIGANDGTIRVPVPVFVLAQSVIGCMIGRSIPISVLAEFGRNWPVFVSGIVSVIVAASALGLLLSRWQVLPGTTAIWGTSPGASTTMIVMSEAYGGDIRLVAVMQHLRVVGVAIAATMVSRIWAGSAGGVPPSAAWFPAVAWAPFLMTMLFAAGCAVAATVLRIPAGAILIPLVGGMVLQESGWMTIELPPALLAISYAIAGWSIGLRFTRPILRHTFRALPIMLASTVTLIALCGAIAAALVVVAGIDPLTAYLATSPGGLDSVAIIALSSNVDVRFVLAMQTARLVVALIISPIIARFLARRDLAARRSGPPP